MTRDPRQHVLPGDPLRLAAEQVNALNRLSRSPASVRSGPESAFEKGRNIILVRNDSGQAVDRWGVLQIGGIVIDPSSSAAAASTFQDQPCVIGVMPTGVGEPFVVAIEPIASSGIGRAAIAGVVQCKLDVTNAGDKFAGPKTGSSAEMKTGGGSSRILWKQGGTGGGKWGLVRISGGDGDPVRLCKTTAVWNRDTIATLNVWEAGAPPGETQSTGQTVEAVNKMHKVASGTWVIVARAANGTWYLAEAGDNQSSSCASPSIAGRDLTELPGYDAAKKQALTHDLGCLKWIDLEDCPA